MDSGADSAEFSMMSMAVQSGKSQRSGGYGLPVSLLVTLFLYLLAFPPFNIAEAGYVFAVPFLVWSGMRGGSRKEGIWLYVTGVVAWCVLLIWLRHVTWGGMFLLSAILGIFWASFLWLSSSVLQRIIQSRGAVRVMLLLGVAGAGVVLEYLRSVLLTGFPWLPLAASQWNRPAMLQVLEFTGSWGLSFVLYFFNLALASYLIRLLKRTSERKWQMNPEMLLALLLAFALPLLLYQNVRGQERVPLLRAGVLQPYIPAVLRWDPVEFQENTRIIWNQNSEFVEQRVDLVLMPEAVLPVPISVNYFRIYLESLASETQTPILTGIMDEQEGVYYSGAAVITPDSGIQPPYYKRKLVPFGEYVPLIHYLPFLKSVLPIEFEAGTDAAPLAVPLADRELYAGILVCYEDIFPHLAREVVLEGADFLFVATNNAWYGEEAGAYQHAVHSVLRAVETRRPVVRCGNGGWSGWFDEYGNQRDSPMSQEGTIYFRGTGILEMDRDSRWVDRQTFYVRYGDWFVLWAGLFAVIPVVYLLRVYWGKRRPSDKLTA